MKLVLATNHLGLGGSESYLITVAEQFDRLGHETVLYTHEPGEGVRVAQERGLAVVGEEGLPDDCDAALVQDAGVSYVLAERLPAVPQLFVVHSESIDLQAPPQLDGAVGAVVALNDRVAARMRSFATAVEVVRLRQPIDTERFGSRGPLPEVARRALLLSNAPSGDRFRMLEAACAEAGLELARLGGESGQATDPRAPLARAEVVIGYGRSILEAMAMGRAAYVYDWNGGEGWVTAASYAAIEADGIAGRSGAEVVDSTRLAEDLAGYRASMGPVNHDLVIAHHRANVHAQRLLELLRGLAAPGPRPRAPLQEMARLVRLEWRARGDASGLARENSRLHELLVAREDELVRARETMLEERRLAAERIGAYERSRTWRLARPLRAVGRALRRLRS